MRPCLRYPALLILAFGCTTGKSEPQATEDTATAWWEEGVDGSDEDTNDDSDDSGDNPDDSDDDSGDKPDDSGDKPDDSGDKPDDSGIYSDADDCPEDFDPTDTCEGDWTTTLCFHDGMLWWCEDGTWMNEDDKPE